MPCQSNLPGSAANLCILIWVGHIQAFGCDTCRVRPWILLCGGCFSQHFGASRSSSLGRLRSLEAMSHWYLGIKDGEWQFITNSLGFQQPGVVYISAEPTSLASDPLTAFLAPQLKDHYRINLLCKFQSLLVVLSQGCNLQGGPPLEVQPFQVCSLAQGDGRFRPAKGAHDDGDGH